MNESNQWTISYKQLGVVIASFSLGLIVTLLISNSQTGTQSNFTTTELIGFVLSVILSGASIVLAIAAIALGKVSEQSVIERSDESIRLQNEVFVKTTEALQRIEASTGVTEKRIEDIISGRVGDISHQVAEIASRHSKQSPKATKELEEAIRQSLMQEIRRESNDERKAQRLIEREEAEKKEKLYNETHDKILLSVGNLDGVKINKVGHGTIGEDGENAFDGLFEKDGILFAISTFRPNINALTLQAFLSAVAEESNNRNISKIFFVIFQDDESDLGVKEKLEATTNLLKDEVKEKFNFIQCSFEEYSQAVELVEGTL